MNSNEMHRELPGFDSGERSKQAIAPALFDALRGATWRRMSGWGSWFIEGCREFAPKLERAWCQVALVEQGLDVLDIESIKDFVDTDVSGRDIKRSLRLD